MNELLDNFGIYSDDQLMELAQGKHMGFPVERLPFGS